MLAKEGSKGDRGRRGKGSDGDNAPRTGGLFSSFMVSGDTLRGVLKGCSAVLPLLEVELVAGCVGGGERGGRTSLVVLTWSPRTLGSFQDRNGYHELF